MKPEDPDYPTVDREAETKPTLAPPVCRLSSHDDDTLCQCVCHRYPMISHLRPCCRTCSGCGFKVQIRYPSEDDVGDP